jgi:LPXTG-motif cell wall-anchored protein
MSKRFGLLLWSLAGLVVSQGAVAVTTNAPEIDPASAMSGLMLLSGGLLILRGRRRKK